MSSARWWVSFWIVYVMCGIGFQQIWRPTFSSPPHFLISPSLSWDWIWRGSKADLGFILFVSYFWQIRKTHLLYVLRRDILGLWKDYLLCVLRRDLLGLWKGVFWVYEWEFVGFVKRGFFGLPIRRKKCLDLEIDFAKKMLN